jgi:hypothetical protein
VPVYLNSKEWWSRNSTSLLSHDSIGARVPTDSNGKESNLAIQRWKALDLQMPGAVVMVEAEDDVWKIVGLPRAANGILRNHQVNIAPTNRVPFVPESGGHSSWSTIVVEEQSSASVTSREFRIEKTS